MPNATSTVLYAAMSDGVRLAMRVYGQLDSAKPVLLGASPYRFDNDDVPESTTFLWKETGPIDWYVEHGYLYVHLDVRGSGCSEGEYGFLDSRERRDLYEIIEWIAVQNWSTGKVGGIGQSYYAASQWCMASERPPHLACIAPYDGGVDLYRQWTYHGGIQCDFNTSWWHGNVRPINLHPFGAAVRRDLPLDLPRELSLHPLIDSFWKDRDFAEKLDGCEIPVFSVGIWAKPELHLPGNLEGFNRMMGPKQLLVTGAPNMAAAQADFESIAFHEKHLLAFYDKFLKGADTPFGESPNVSLEMREAKQTVSGDCWPPATEQQILLLSALKAHVSDSLNDGSLVEQPAYDSAESTSYSYPDPKWGLGNVELTPHGPNPTSRNLTFTSEPLTEPMDLMGYPTLKLSVSSTRDDLDIIVKLVELRPGGEHDAPPTQARIISKGWLRASHRAILDRRFGIRHRHDVMDPLVPHQIYDLELSLTPLGHRLVAGSRIRLDVSCTDAAVTDAIFTHTYTPDMVGTDTIYHSRLYVSSLALPVLKGDGKLAESKTD